MTGYAVDLSQPVDWDNVPPCPFADAEEISKLRFRDAPYWHSLAKCRHIGVYRPNAHIATWTARILTSGKRYRQKRIGSALPDQPDRMTYPEARRRAVEWFASGGVQRIANGSGPVGRTTSLNFCPIGETYTVGSALADYIEWSRIARSAGSHYNNMVLINFHLSGELLFVPLEDFSARHLKDIAIRVLETPPHHGFSRACSSVAAKELSADALRRRKRVFNSLVTILRVAFQHAWDNGNTGSDRPWRCLKRIAVAPAPRTLFLSREECQNLVDNCSPALGRLVLAALYSGCRVGELACLRVCDVGREVYGLHIAAFKRGPARFVFLPDEGMAFFLSCCDGKEQTDRLLVSDMGKVWQRQHTSLFRRAVQRARLPREFVFHGLRHTYASDLVRQGVPLSVVARQLGHTDTRTVSATYGHLAEQFREDQVRTRFSPLSETAQREAILRRPQLDALWKSVHRGGWRAYGSGLDATSRPIQSYVRTDLGVLEAFGRGGTHAAT